MHKDEDFYFHFERTIRVVNINVKITVTYTYNWWFSDTIYLHTFLFEQHDTVLQGTKVLNVQA